MVRLDLFNVTPSLRAQRGNPESISRAPGLLRHVPFLAMTFIFVFYSIPPTITLAAEPLELTADKALEWHRDTQKVIARGNVIAKQGQTALHSDIIRANYKEGKSGEKFNLTTMNAQGNVKIISEDGTAYGDKATFNTASNTAILTGNNLRMTTQSGDMILTAAEKFEYDIDGGKLSALGSPKLTQTTDTGNNTITADTLSAIFQQSANDKRALEQMVANGNVVITTPTEIITGDNGTYNKSTNTAELAGNVTIKRGPNELKGARAVVDLNTNISTLSGGENNTGRVKGVFYPE